MLLSYIVHPFILNQNRTLHTNIQEVKLICEIAISKGYSLDIVDYRNTRNIDLSIYDYVFGFGEQVERLFKGSVNADTDVVVLATGSFYTFQNRVAIERLQRYRERYGECTSNVVRVVEDCWPLQWSMANRLLVIGNSVTASTFPKITQRVVTCLSASYIKNTNAWKILNRKKGAAVRKKNVLWFGGPAFVHKGLDLVLEALRFDLDKDVKLHICGVENDDNDFLRLKASYSDLPITSYGMISLDSPEFSFLMDLCTYVVLPSCSEGQATSVINVVANSGMLPIITREVGLDMNHGAIEILSCDFESVHRSLVEAFSMMDAEYFERCSANLDYIVNANSPEKYISCLEESAF